MPQETALVDELTLREVLWLYGTIYGLSSVMIKDKISFLSNLLELPDDQNLIKECSIGEQRRISFAVSLIHDPKLLILDEPTVGMDLVLRTSVWNHLKQLTQKQNVTVLLSTHYVEEAKQSTHVGMMRNGVLIAEDRQQNFLDKLGVAHLDNAFIMLSRMQEDNPAPDMTLARPKPLKISLKHQKKETYGVINFRVLFALLAKNFLQLFRYSGFRLLITIFPIVAIACIHFTIGRKLTGLRLGIVNDEVLSPATCWNEIARHSSSCNLEKLSCRFIKEFDDESVKKVRFGAFFSLN
jgi:ABC transporter